MKSPYSIIVRPVITEATTTAAEKETGAQYTFEVHPSATKPEIRSAIQKIYNVKVASVNTLVRKGKLKRLRIQVGRTAAKKKAIITLAEGQRIERF